MRIRQLLIAFRDIAQQDAIRWTQFCDLIDRLGVFRGHFISAHRLRGAVGGRRGYWLRSIGVTGCAEKTMFQFDRPQAHRMIRLRRRCNDLVVVADEEFSLRCPDRFADALRIEFERASRGCKSIFQALPNPKISQSSMALDGELIAARLSRVAGELRRRRCISERGTLLIEVVPEKFCLFRRELELL